MWKRGLIYAGVLLHVLAAIYSVGHYHVDEHFQLLEFAGFKLGITPVSDLAWEYEAALRPAVQPAFAFAVYKIMALFGAVNPFTWAMLLRLLSVGLSLLAARIVYKRLLFNFSGEEGIRTPGNATIPRAEILFWLFTLLFWCMPYNHARFSSENWSGALFLLGIAIFPYGDTKALRPLLLSGFLLGFSLVFRYQSAFMIAGFGLWLLIIHRIRFSTVISLLLSVLSVMGIGILLDYWLYGKWVFTFWNYFEVNILQNKAAEFGTEPWWFYITEGINKLFIPFGLLIFLAFATLVLARPRHMLVWIILPFLLAHMFIGHKEIRFLFPLIHLLPWMLVALYLAYSAKFNSWYLKKATRYALAVLLFVNLLMGIPVSLQPASKRVALLKYLYSRKPATTGCLQQNPYKDKLWLNVYMPRGTDVKNLQVSADPDSLDAYRITVPEYQWDKAPASYMRVYTQAPPFAEKININNWLSRTEFWSVYESKQSPR